MKRAIVLFFLLTLSGLLFGGQFTVTSPQGGEKWFSGSQHNITWTFSNIPGTTQVKLILFKNGTKVGTIVENIPIGSNGAGTYPWHAGAYVGGDATGDGYQIRIRDMNNQYPMAESPAAFTIFVRIVPSFAETKTKYVPPAQHPVHSAGTVTIPYNHYCDLDTGHLINTVAGTDLWWSQNSIAPYQRVLIPGANSKFKALGVWATYTYESLRSGSGYTNNPIVDDQLPINMVVGYLTDEMRSGALRVVAKGSDGSLTIAWVTYDIH